MAKSSKDELLFLPLGGSNEIGMNVNLYKYKDKWLMIDLGAGFADDEYPGVHMLAPDLAFLENKKDDLLGIVLTHAHEDHIGSLRYVWDQLGCPIYATPFTAAMARAKLDEQGWLEDGIIHEFEPGGSLEIGPFTLDCIQLTHSIPEMNAIVLKTEHGNVLHTGDWKFDPDPVVGDVSDLDALKKLGEEGVLALVCDSTNVFNDRFSGSEGDLLENLVPLIEEARGMVMVTTFASNVARMDTICRAAERTGRKVFLAGWSLRRISAIAQETGYLKDVTFYNDNEIKQYNRDEVLVMCTGCQGEENAAMNKIAHGTHRTIRATQKDTVIFSSKIIPGNEKTIFKLFNQLTRLGCEVYTEKDHKVHVSGHPSSEELKKMYELTKPHTAIPVHGEPTHLHAHAALARSVGVPNAVEVKNGQVVKLAPGTPKLLALEHSGYFAVDGKQLLPRDGQVLKQRRWLRDEGGMFISLVLMHDGALIADPVISTPGVLDEQHDRDFIDSLKDDIADLIENLRDPNDERIAKSVKKFAGGELKHYAGKAPLIHIHISRVD